MDGSSSSKRRVEARRERESNTKRLNVTMEVDTLDCPICCEPLRPPIFQVKHRLAFGRKLIFIPGKAQDKENSFSEAIITCSATWKQIVRCVLNIIISMVAEIMKCIFVS